MVRREGALVRYEKFDAGRREAEKLAAEREDFQVLEQIGKKKLPGKK